MDGSSQNLTGQSVLVQTARVKFVIFVLKVHRLILSKPDHYMSAKDWVKYYKYLYMCSPGIRKQGVKARRGEGSALWGLHKYG